MKYVQKLRTVALAGATLLLAAGSLGAQDRSDRAARRARESAVVAAQSPQWTVLSLGRARLGVYPDMDQGSDIDAKGARITGVVEGGPADEAGLQEGDIIVSLNGRSVLKPLPDPLDERRLSSDEPLPVQRLIATARKLDPGDDVEVVYLRDGKQHTVTLKAEEAGAISLRLGRVMPEIEGRLRSLREDELRQRLEDRQGEGPSVYRFFGNGDQPWVLGLGDHGVIGRCPGDHAGWSVLMEGCVAGLELVPLNQRLGQYFESDQGVLVADVTEDSELGLQPGDVILSIDGRNVDDPGDVTRILRSYDSGEKVSFSIVRKGDHRTVEGTVK